MRRLDDGGSLYHRLLCIGGRDLNPADHSGVVNYSRDFSFVKRNILNIAGILPQVSMNARIMLTFAFVFHIRENKTTGFHLFGRTCRMLSL
jgi:hypothetical protein